MKSTVGKVSAIMVLVTFMLASALVLNVALAQNNSSEANITGLMLLNNTSNETVGNITLNESIDYNVTNENASDNVTYVGGNISLIETVSLNDYVTVSLNKIDTNETSQENNETSEETPEETPDKPTFDVQLNYPQRITRGEEIVVTAELTSDVFAKNVYLKWLLPIGFEIISGNAIETCGDLFDKCISNISVRTDNAGTGLGEIRVVVDYEE